MWELVLLRPFTVLWWLLFEVVPCAFSLMRNIKKLQIPIRTVSMHTNQVWNSQKWRMWFQFVFVQFGVAFKTSRPGVFHQLCLRELRHYLFRWLRRHLVTFLWICVDGNRLFCYQRTATGGKLLFCSLTGFLRNGGYTLILFATEQKLRWRQNRQVLVPMLALTLGIKGKSALDDQHRINFLEKESNADCW